MYDSPLLISSLIRHAARVFGDQEMVTRSVEGPIHRTNYRELHARAQQLAHALVALGVQPGDRVATLAWNTHRHVEVYFGVSGIGAICHTLNPRLAPEQLCYILNHAEDVILFVDLTFLPALARLRGACKHLRKIVVLSDRAHLPADSSDLVASKISSPTTLPPSPGPPSTRTPPPRSVTPPAPPASPRASSTRTAPPSCTPSPSPSPTSSTSASTRPSSPSCRCSTSTPGASPTPPP